MNVNPAVVALLQKQEGTISQAEAEVRALRVATRIRDYKGFHKFCRRVQSRLEEDAREIREFIAEYCGDTPYVSATTQVACQMMQVSEVPERILAAAWTIQNGWEEISGEAQGTGDNSVDAMADDYMEAGNKVIMELTRIVNAFTDAGGDRSYWKLLDKELLKKYG
jgi:ferritin